MVERQTAGLGLRFLESIEEAFVRIERSPRSWLLVHGDVRIVSTRRFPYVVYYRIVEDEAVVIGVFHNRRDPRAWRTRI